MEWLFLVGLCSWFLSQEFRLWCMNRKLDVLLEVASALLPRPTPSEKDEAKKLWDELSKGEEINFRDFNALLNRHIWGRDKDEE